MGGFNITVEVDVSKLRRLKNMISGAGNTLDDVGRGMVFVGRRKKLFWESRRPAHSFLILNQVRSQRGVDPVAPTPEEKRQQEAWLAIRAQRAVDLAIRTGRDQSDRVRAALGRGGGGVAKMMADDAFKRITEGRTGLQNTPRRREKKRRLARVGGERGRQRFVGYTTQVYGVPPPFLIDTGRLVRSIKSRWNLGHRRQAP